MSGDPFQAPQPDLLTCRACARDVSVARGAGPDPRCPRCGGALERPQHPAGDAQEHTLLEARRRSPDGRERAGEPGGEPGHGGGASAPERRDEARRTGQGAPADRLLIDLPPAPLPGEETDPTLLDPAPPDTATSPEGAAERARSPGTELSGQQLGPYRLQRILGKGGMGVVYEAYHPALDRTVALKLMSGDDAGEEELARFEREARAAARLQHPNIVPVFDTGQVEGKRYFTMDLVRGRTLQALARAGELAPERAARLVARVAHAIQHAHDQGVIHRDLKPSNVLVEDESGEPKVTDFGLAKDLSEQVAGLTLTGVAMGSPPYMPPEQARGDFRLVDAVSDVYGLGAILYECLTQTPPFGGKSLYDVIAKVLAEEPVAPRRKNPSVPVDLETICLKALEKEKWRRYQSARELARDLERFLEGQTIGAAPHGLTTRIGRGLARHRHQFLAAGVPLLAVLGLLALLFGPGEAQPTSLPPPPPSPARPLDRAAEQLTSNKNGAVALREVLGLCWESRRGPAPTLDELRGAVEAGLQGEARQVALRVLLGQEEARAATEEALAALLALRERGPEPPALAGLAVAWTEPAEPLRALLARTALAAGLDAHRDPRALERLGEAIQRGPPTVLDLALLELFLPPEPVPGLAPLGIDPEVATRPAPLRGEKGWQVRAQREGLGERWRFPPRDPREVPGLQPPAPGPEWLRPTEALRTRDGGRVLVGWLRFVHLLDDRDGRVLCRARLPGPALGLHLGPEGPVVDVAQGGVARPLLVEVVGQALRLRWPGSDAPPGPLELVPSEEVVALDELRRAAWAELPLLDDRIPVWTQGQPRPELRPWWVRPDPPGAPPRLLRPAALWFDQGERTPCLGAPLVSVAPQLGRYLRPGDLLVDLALPSGARAPRPGEPEPDPIEVELRIEREGGAGPFWFRYSPPARALSDPEWLRTWLAAERLAGRDPDPNPWTVAAAGVAAARVARALPRGPAPLAGLVSAPLRRELVARAAEHLARAAASPHLAPREQVELACWLDRLGHAAPADLALAEALGRLVREHALLPEWAGYGAVDAGVPLARRVEEAWFTGHLERARELRRWRDLFAPVLSEGPAAREMMERQGAPLELGEGGPAPVVASGPAPRKGVAGLDAPALLQVEHGLRFQHSFVGFVGGFLLLMLLRHRRHGTRDLARIGCHGPAARAWLWLERPLTRLRFSWPAYMTFYDKAALVLLYVACFAAYGVQDAGFEALVALRNPPQAALAGLPGERQALDALERACSAWRPVGESQAAVEELRGLHAALRASEDQGPGRATPRSLALALGRPYQETQAGLEALARAGLARRAQDPAPAEVVYARAWAKQAAGVPWDEVRLAWRDALASRREPRALLGLAEALLARGEREEALGLVREALELDPDLAPARLLQARLLGAAPEARWLEATAAGSRRQAVLRALGREPLTPLAPPPDVTARDVLLCGTARWTGRIPGRVARDLVLPVPGRVDQSLLAFNEAWQLNETFGRVGNRLFWLVPCTLGLLVLWLVVGTPHWFEPVDIDVALPRGVPLLAALVPGVPQIMRGGRSVRGVLLLVPAFYLAQTLYNSAVVGRQLLGQLQEKAHLGAPEQATLTADAACAIPLLKEQHFRALAMLLLVVYALHWLDLGLAAWRRRRRRSSPHSGTGSLVIPVDTLSGPASQQAPVERSSPGPFDRSQPAG